MSLRPKRAQWFEVIVSKDDCSATTEALAGTAQVQFECAGERSAKELFAELREPLENYRTLLPAYRDWWPDPVFEDRCCVLPMESAAKFAMGRLQVWQRRAQPRIDERRALEASRAELLLWQQILDHLSDSELDLGALSESGPLLIGLCLLLPSTADPSSFAQLLSVTVPLEGQRAILALVRQQDAEALCRQAEALHGRCLPVPKWLEGAAQPSRSRLTERLSALELQIGQATTELRELAERTGVARSLGVLERLDWLISHAHNLASTEDFCWITGWTTVTDETVLNRALADSGVAASVEFLEAPEHVRSPSLFDNPAWARPFEVFTRAMGMPAADEADPSTWVAVLVPLMFGYMCGDVGHGLVIALAGLVLQRHWPVARLLVFCGVAATGFGFLYGDLFGMEDVLSPWWLRPLDDPLLTLAVPVAGGAVVLTLGLLLNSVQLCWLSGQRLAWVAEIAQLCVYWGIVLAFFQPALILLTLVGVVLCGVYRLWIERSGTAALSSFGELIENTLQLLLNTLSFVRVGAFALAHAGLSSAVFALADNLTSSTAHLTVMILGNVVIIVLEGLVVSIQATRLVLFEFFVRFFRGQGRAFEPAHSPPAVPRGHHHGH
jgi:V/A-type H+-transporting ATPase subunit I